MLSSGRIFSILFLAVLQFDPVISTACYYPNGVRNNSTDYAPCPRVDGGPSMCCAIKNRGDNIDVCTASGLCLGQPLATGSRLLWRESCTDPTWQSPNCLNLCTAGIASGRDIELTVCPNGDLCCGFNNTACCDQNRGTRMEIFSSTTSATSSSNTIGASTTAVIPAITATSEMSIDNIKSKNIVSLGTAVGVSITVVLLILLTFGCVTYIVVRRRQRTIMTRSGFDLNEKRLPLTPGISGLQVVRSYHGWGGQRPRSPPLHPATRRMDRDESDSLDINGPNEDDTARLGLPSPRRRPSAWSRVLELANGQQVHEMPT